MTITVPSAVLATIQPVFTDAERVALAGFLAGYRGLTRGGLCAGPAPFTSWCRARSLALFAVRRADIEGFARELGAMGRAWATVTRRLSTIAGFYRYAVEEESWSARRPRMSASHVSIMSLTRSHWITTSSVRLLVAAGLGSPRCMR